jgi:hypothetical protein
VARRLARAKRVRGLELFGPRTQVELVSPGAAMLAMQHQVHFGDLVWMQHAILAEARVDTRNSRPRAIAIDDSIDDNVGYVDTLRTKLARDTLRDHTKSGFGGRKWREVGATAQTPGRAGENDRAGPPREQVWEHRLRQQKTRQRMSTPMLLEHFRSYLEKRRALVTACILNSNVQGRQRLGAGDKTPDIAGVSHIAYFDMGSPPDRGNTLCGLSQLVVTSSCNDDREPGRGEDARGGGTETSWRTNTKDQDTTLLNIRHDSLSGGKAVYLARPPSIARWTLAAPRVPPLATAHSPHRPTREPGGLL